MSADPEVIKVLVVDDDPIVRSALASYFERAADTVVVGSATDGLEAVAAARHEVDVVVIDVRMP
ncbi:MAG: response regulator, partial [Gammaproteobacteria bacterium]|nr:response regulator [Gammaproteobacteria bacterium]